MHYVHHRGIAIVSRPSVRLPVRLWRSGTVAIISWLSSKVVMLKVPQYRYLVQGEHSQNSGRIGVGSLFWAENLQYLWNGARQDQDCHWWLIGSRIRAFRFCQNQRPWMTLNELCTGHAFSDPITKIWMKIDPYYQRRKCRRPMTLVSGDIRFMRIFAGVLWRRGVKRQWGNRKRRFSGLSDATSSLP